MMIEMLTPLAVVLRGECAAVDVPADGGRLTVLPRHQALVCLLKDGLVYVDSEDALRETWRVAGASLSVSDNKVTLLAAEAERA
ncbi:MAG: F0F1 ATP synthase subunit epsilon [Lentisphaerales bacterium]|jgi:F0F1-type ATP synthase epsilon subunit|nr:MAG: F0F1 ATP synthase subunit epsilon [Lentisphaerales bacterium]